MKSWVFLCLFLISVAGLAQDKHNFKMGPAKTDCHTVGDLKNVPQDSALSMLLSAEFRFKEEVQISRYRTPRELAYMSCEGEDGYMIAKEDNDRIKLFQKVPKILWDSLINTPDPISFYNSSVFKKYLVKKLDN
ncbi:MAG: hypothetical protein ABJH05_11440 [Fulvivirga sp.]